MLLKNKISLAKFYKASKFSFLHTISERKFPIEKENKITIYSSPEIEELKTTLNNNQSHNMVLKKDIWKNYILNKNSTFSKKYYSLLTLFFENQFSNASEIRFIIEMNLIPEKKYLNFKCVEASGILEFEENLSDIVPIIPEDYLFKKKILNSALPKFVDGDMLYINKKTLTTYCFDKQGTWHKEGVNHELLNIGNCLNEKKWFDHIITDTNWI